MKDKNVAPAWAPDAVPSPAGWLHPVTGEVLKTVKGLTIPVAEELPEPVEPVEVLRNGLVRGKTPNVRAQNEDL